MARARKGQDRRVAAVVLADRRGLVRVRVQHVLPVRALRHRRAGVQVRDHRDVYGASLPRELALLAVDLDEERALGAGLGLRGAGDGDVEAEVARLRERRAREERLRLQSRSDSRCLSANRGLTKEAAFSTLAASDLEPLDSHLTETALLKTSTILCLSADSWTDAHLSPASPETETKLFLMPQAEAAPRFPPAQKAPDSCCSSVCSHSP